MRRRLTFAAALLALLLPAAAIAQFGGIVHDPINWTALSNIWGEDISTGQKILQEYNQIVKIYTVAVQEYTLAQQMAQRSQQKAAWLTIATRFTNQVTQNRYGETVNYSAAMNGDWVHAGQAYGNMTTRLSDRVDLSREPLGASTHLANLGASEAIDSSNASCLQAAAQYRASQTANQPAFDALSFMQADEGDGSNAYLAQFNQLNGAAAQQRAEAQSRGTLQACLVEQQALANTMQRNLQVGAFNTYAQAQQSLSANGMQLSGMSAGLKADIQ